jgi:hypothetical protein
MQDRRVIRGALGSRRPIEVVGEDRLDRAVVARADVDGAGGGGVEPLASVGHGEPQDAEAGAEALLGVRPRCYSRAAGSFNQQERPDRPEPDAGGLTWSM